MRAASSGLPGMLGRSMARARIQNAASTSLADAASRACYMSSSGTLPASLSKNSEARISRPPSWRGVRPGSRARARHADAGRAARQSLTTIATASTTSTAATRMLAGSTRGHSGTVTIGSWQSAASASSTTPSSTPRRPLFHHAGMGRAGRPRRPDGSRRPQPWSAHPSRSLQRRQAAPAERPSAAHRAGPESAH